MKNILNFFKIIFIFLKKLFTITISDEKKLTLKVEKKIKSLAYYFKQNKLTYKSNKYVRGDKTISITIHIYNNTNGINTYEYSDDNIFQEIGKTGIFPNDLQKVLENKIREHN